MSEENITEDTEQLDEISKKTLARYVNLANNDKLERSEDSDKMRDAENALLSIKYKKKHKFVNHGYGYTASGEKLSDAEHELHHARIKNDIKIDNRTKGIKKALKKLATENMEENMELEQIEESLELQVPEVMFERIIPVFEAKSEAVSTEAVSTLFEGTELSDEFKTKAATIFEATLNSRIAEAVESINEQAQAVLAERLELAEATLLEQVDSYVSSVVNEWVEENQLELQQSIISEKAVAFASELKDLLEKHNVFITPDAEAEIMSEQAKTEAVIQDAEILATALTEAEQKIEALETELFEREKADVFNEMTEGFADSQVEKFAKLLEGFEFETIEQFKEKATVVKEAFVAPKTQTVTETKTQTLSEESSSVAKYAEAAKKAKSIY